MGRKKAKKQKTRHPGNRTGSGRPPLTHEELAEAGKPYRFQPGMSGNPSGRPKGGLSKMLRQLLASPVGKSKHQLAELFIRSVLNAAIKGDSAMARLVFERSDGKVALDLGDFGSADIEVMPPKIVVNFIQQKPDTQAQLPPPQISVKPPLPPEEESAQNDPPKPVIEMPKKASWG